MSEVWFRLVRLIFDKGVLPVFWTTVCIQGTLICCQLVAALLVSPSDIGVIRSIETMLAILVLAGGMGGQALAIRDVAEASTDTERMKILCEIYLIVLICGILLVPLFLVSEWLLGESVLLGFIFAMLGIVPLTNFLRVTTGYAQGASILQFCYKPLLIFALVAITLHGFFTFNWGMQGWVFARYMSEIVSLCGVLFFLRKFLKFDTGFKSIDIFSLLARARHGLIVNLGGLVRLLADSAPMLLLIIYKVPVDIIGEFGLAILILMSVMLPLAVLSQRYLPLLVQDMDDAYKFKKRFENLVFVQAGVGLVGAFSLSLIAFLAMKYIGGKYEGMFNYLAALSWVLPLKAFALSFGTKLMVLRSYKISLLVNCCEVFLVFLAGFILIPLMPNVGVGIVFFIGALFSSLALYGACIFLSKNGNNK